MTAALQRPANWWGYQGAEAVGAEILKAVALVKQRNPEAIYCCDPVIGDIGRGIYVRPGIPEFMRDQVVPAADVVTPNHFELDYLSGIESRSHAALGEALAALHARGPATILATSVHLDDTPEDAVDLVVSEGGNA